MPSELVAEMRNKLLQRLAIQRSTQSLGVLRQLRVPLLQVIDESVKIWPVDETPHVREVQCPHPADVQHGRSPGRTRRRCRARTSHSQNARASRSHSRQL